MMVKPCSRVEAEQVALQGRFGPWAAYSARFGILPDTDARIRIDFMERARGLLLNFALRLAESDH